MLQLPLNVLLDDSAKFDNFFDAGNQQINKKLKLLNQNPGDFIFVWGAPESGKTHLAQSICHQFDSKGLSAFYLPLNDPNLTPDVLAGMSCMDLVCLDDINNVLDSENDSMQWQIALFDLYNNLKLENKCLVIFSSAAPKHLKIDLADLTSRLTSMEVYKLELLDDKQKKEFFQQRALNRGVEITDEVAQFILARQSRSVSDLITILDKIDHSSIALKRKVTIPLIKQIFNL